MKRKWISLAAVLAAVAILMGACGGGSSGGGTAPLAPASSRPQQASSTEPESRAESRPTGPAAGDNFTWVMEPSLDYDDMLMAPDDSGGISLLDYVNVSRGGRWGTVRFQDGSTLLPMEAERGGLSICFLGHASFGTGGMSQEALVATLKSDGIYVDPMMCAHGGNGTAFFVRSPSTGAMTLCALPGVGPGYYPVDYLVMQSALPYIESEATEGDESFEWESVKKGVASIEGRVLTDCVYSAVLEPVNGVCAVRQGEKYGYVRADTGQTILGCVLGDPMDSYGQWYRYTGSFNEGVCAVQDPATGRYGYIDMNGQPVVATQFEGATHVRFGLAWVKQGGKWGQIKLAEGATIPPLEGLDADYGLLGLIGQSSAEAETYFGEAGRPQAAGDGQGLYFIGSGVLARLDANGVITALEGDVAHLLFQTRNPITYAQLSNYFGNYPPIVPNTAASSNAPYSSTIVGANYTFYPEYESGDESIEGENRCVYILVEKNK